jgi:type VI protein secretion system component Hcp
MKIKHSIILTAACFALVASGFGANPRYYFKLPPVTGDSTVRGHENEIIATGFEFQVAQGNTYFVLNKGLDSASTQLGAILVSGDTNFSTAKFTAESGGGAGGARRPLAFFTIEFTGLSENSLNLMDAGLADSLPHENVTFSFGSAVLTTYTYGPSGLLKTGTATLTNQ